MLYNPSSTITEQNVNPELITPEVEEERLNFDMPPEDLRSSNTALLIKILKTYVSESSSGRRLESQLQSFGLNNSNLSEVELRFRLSLAFSDLRYSTFSGAVDPKVRQDLRDITMRAENIVFGELPPSQREKLDITKKYDLLKQKIVSLIVKKV